MYAVTNPATGEVLREYPTATDADMENAIAAAAKAYKDWSVKSTVAERAALTRRVGELHTERREELADIMHREMGKPLDQALGEVDFSAAIYEFYDDNAERFLADEPIDLLAGEGSAVIVREPFVSGGLVQPEQELRSEFLHLFADTEVIRSHLPVEMWRGKRDRFVADSLDYDNLSRVVKLKGRVRGEIQPRKKP